MSTRRRIRTRAREMAVELGDAYKFTRDPELAEQRANERRARFERAMSAPTIEWIQCSIRGCDEKIPTRSKTGLFVCAEHALVIWEIVEERDANPSTDEYLRDAWNDRKARRAAKAKAERRENAKPDACGEIYYVKVGGLIKVGWTTRLPERMRSYGPEAELLARFDGTRADETNLHRQLTPSRARGREWYHDDPIIRAFVARAVREHGAPDWQPSSTWRSHQPAPRIR